MEAQAELFRFSGQGGGTSIVEVLGQTSRSDYSLQESSGPGNISCGVSYIKSEFHK